MVEPKQYPRPRMICWRCVKCGNDRMKVLDQYNFDKRPDVQASTICDACIEKMGEPKP